MGLGMENVCCREDFLKLRDISRYERYTGNDTYIRSLLEKNGDLCWGVGC